MSKRQAIGKKLRFEVFKRDSFTCQYCGEKAPDVILHVDHINPVAAGGGNDILNLITSCQPCNSGKGARKLEDRHELEKQREELERLNERREQLTMLLQWRDALTNIEDNEVSVCADEWASLCLGHSLTPTGEQNIKKWVKRFGVDLTITSIHASCEQYLDLDEDGTASSESAGKAFQMIPRIAATKLKEKRMPFIHDLNYVKAILRNRLSYMNAGMAQKLLEDAFWAGADFETLKDIAKFCTSWTHFRKEIEEYINELESE